MIIEVDSTLNSTSAKIQREWVLNDRVADAALNSTSAKIQTAVLQQPNSHASEFSFCLPRTYIKKIFLCSVSRL